MPPDLAVQLRDIHLPADPRWWPPAPGWWLLAGALLLVSVLAWRHLPGWWRRQRVRRAALRELRVLSRRPAGELPMAELSTLLRRVAMSRDPRARVAALTGDRWLEYLDRAAGTREFRHGPGRCLASAPYGGPGPEDAAAVMALAEHWIRRCAGRPAP